MLRYILVALLALHGIVHGFGFGATWRIGPAGTVSATPSLIPGLAPDGPLAHVLGIFWLIALLAFLGAAFGLLTDGAWWRIAAAAAAVVSLALCVAWWSDGKAGAALDIGILVAIVVYTLAGPAAALRGAS
ncbi:MAG TPA: hypothetical protein VGD57_09170 [Candidatus Dormibacteraeota bacterium]